MLTSFPAKLLKSVSRSLYSSLRVVPANLRPVVGIGYLLCRTADTLADALRLSHAERRLLLHNYRALFSTFPLPTDKFSDLSTDLAALNLGKETAEGRLVTSFPRTVEFFSALSRTDQALVSDVVCAVIQGMEMDLTVFGESADTLQVLQTEEELETYLGWIGGEPGRFWSKVCLEHTPRWELTARGRWLEDGIEFGKGLQMINILRDLPMDLKQGRCYIPKERLTTFNLQPADLLAAAGNDRFLTLYHELIDETLDRLRHGLEYALQIPPRHLRLRAAVWWPLTIGLRTLENLRGKTKVLGGPEVTKIKRWEVYGLIGSSLAVLPVNRFLKSTFESMAEGASSSAGIDRR